MTEVFKTISSFTNYEVSNFGRVRRTLKNGSKRYLKNIDNGNGYLRVHLSKNGVSTKMYVHRLVAMSFKRKLKEKTEVHHKDHVKTNNHVSNLEWVTPKQNSRYRTLYYRKLK